MSNTALTQAWAVTGISITQKCILVRLADRAGDQMTCFPCLDRIAAECGCARSTVSKALKDLKASGLLTWKHRKNGNGGLTSNEYRLTLPPVTVSEGRTTPVREPDYPPSEIRTTPVREPVSNPKLNPKNEPKPNQSPKGESIVFPDSLNFEFFQDAWAEWETYKKQKRQKMTPLTIKRQLAKLEKVGARTAVAMLEKSMENGWTGIFDLKTDKGGKKTRPMTDPKLHIGCHD